MEPYLQVSTGSLILIAIVYLSKNCYLLINKMKKGNFKAGCFECQVDNRSRSTTPSPNPPESPEREEV
jgi:hypothetical protein